MDGPSGSTGYITHTPSEFRYEYTVPEPELIPIDEAVRHIWKSLQESEAQVRAAVESGRTYYLAKKIHSVDCRTVKQELWPTASRLWVNATDDPKWIQTCYEEVVTAGGSRRWSPAGKLLTREEAGRSRKKRCQTCVPDVTPSTARPKQVACLVASDLGRLLDGHPVESITYEPGVVTIRTSSAAHQFDVTDYVQLHTPHIGEDSDEE